MKSSDEDEKECLVKGGSTTMFAVQPSRAISSPPEGDAERGAQVLELREPTPMTDEELIVAIEKGREGATSLFYDRFYPTVELTLFRVLGRREDDYDDLVQTVFERLIVSIVDKRFHKRCGLKTWVSTIASNVGIDSIRQRQRHRSRYTSNVEWHLEAGSRREVSGEGRLEARSAFLLVQEAFARIDAAKARILALFHFEGNTVGEIAAIMGISEEACQSRLVRARKRLLRELERLEKGEKS